jgi:hypothetical protein
MEINKAQPLGKFARGFVRFVVSRKHPEPFTERLKNLAAALQSFAKGGQIAGINVDIRRLRNDSRERIQITMDVAEN